METSSDEITQNINNSKFKNKVFLLLRIMISALILYFLFSLVEWKNVEDAFKTADIKYIILAGCLLFANISLRAYKWHIMLYALSNKRKLSESFGSIMLGISLGSFTPGEIGDYAGRALYITEASKSHIIGLVLLDKTQIFIITSIFGTSGLIFIALNNLTTSVIFFFFLLIVVFLILLRFKSIFLFIEKINIPLIKKSLLLKIIEGFSLLNSKKIFSTVMLTILFHLIIVLQMYLLINAFGEISLFNSIIGTSAMLFAKSIIPISFSDLGVREAGSIFFFSNFSINQATALNASLLLFFINIFIPAIAGLFFLKRHNISYINALIYKYYKSLKNDRDNCT